jgi:CheY-like chemotaxis protein
MTPEIREQVFEPFFTTKEAGKGTGLGLSMIFGFVKQSGGHVAIESAVGEGTSVRIYLPRYEGEEAVAQTQRVADTDDNGRGELILVVEDDADLRATMVGSLRSLGYEVLDADTADMALTVLEQRPDVDLLLTDVVLPAGKNGRILAEKARERFPHLHVLFVSGYTGDAITRHWRLDEGVQLLEKPFRTTEIARAVRKALHSDSVS